MSTEGEPRRSSPAGGEPTEAAEPPVPEPIELPKIDPTGSEVPITGAVPAQHEPADQDGPPRRTGSIRYQDENTTPREPTLAERRARLQAQRQAEEAEEAQLAEDARKAKTRKRVMIGGGVTVGVAALIAIGYAVSRPDTTEARCVDTNNVVVDDNNCVQPAADASSYNHGGGYYGGGLIPIFIGAGGGQYHYNYGGQGNLGQVATGGTTVAPRNGTVTTGSGRTVAGGSLGRSSGGSVSGGSSGDTSAGSSSVRRGGFGVGGDSSSSSSGRSSGGS
ncbi:MAG TPA: hypothetical protein VH008_05540 [Pseudonocardia sp.]|nr:hypothetical protein [Pseudonocardia sp.]